ncbi:4025_t:CDS:2, partial [Racocetra persica]
LTKGNQQVKWGEFGLQAQQGNYIYNHQIEAARKVISKFLKKSKAGQMKANIFPHLGKTGKSLERMGLPQDISYQALTAASYKLPGKYKGRGIINGYFSFNNTILNLSKENGEVLCQVSAGSLGERGTRKATAGIAERVAEEIIKKASDYGIKEIELQVRNPGTGRDTVIKKILEAKSLQVRKLTDKTPVAFNGTRPRKRPRK